jgi:hypothetical protein
MGGAQAVQPLLGKEGIWPEVIVRSSGTAFPFPPSAQDTSQSHPYPFLSFSLASLFLRGHL